jgi:hypothetical protein
VILIRTEDASPTEASDAPLDALLFAAGHPSRRDRGSRVRQVCPRKRDLGWLRPGAPARSRVRSFPRESVVPLHAQGIGLSEAHAVTYANGNIFIAGYACALPS